MRTYYNEFDPGAAAWLRELISAGRIPAGDVAFLAQRLGYVVWGDSDGV